MTRKSSMSDGGIQLLKLWEGIVLTVYRDVAGLPTIGVGHLLTRSELMSGKLKIGRKTVKYLGGITEEQALELLRQDLRDYENAVNKFVKVELSQNQFDALVSFCFNVGETAFMRSTLVKLLNDGQYDEVPAQLRRWVYAGGQRRRGLELRRQKEIGLWHIPAANLLA